METNADGMVNASPEYGLAPAETRAVTINSRSLWAIPGTAGLCAVTQTSPDPQESGQRIPDSNCVDVNTAMSGGLIAAALEPDGSHMIFGVVPDGNPNIALTLPSGAVVTIPVVDNAVLQDVAAIPQAISLKNADGNVVTVPFGG